MRLSRGRGICLVKIDEKLPPVGTGDSGVESIELCSPLGVGGVPKRERKGSHVPLTKAPEILQKLKFSGRKKLEDTRLNPTQVEPKTKELPDYIYQDFIGNRRNPNQLLNQFCQIRRLPLKFDEIASNNTNFRNWAVCAKVGDKSYEPGYSSNKKLAKEAAANNALKSVLLEYYRTVGQFPKQSETTQVEEKLKKLTPKMTRLKCRKVRFLESKNSKKGYRQRVETNRRHRIITEYTWRPGFDPAPPIEQKYSTDESDIEDGVDQRPRCRRKKKSMFTKF